MSNNLPARPLLGGLTTSRDERALAKQWQSLHTGASLELAQIHVAETLAHAKVEALRSTGHVGLAAADSITADVYARAQANPAALPALSRVGEPIIRAIAHRVEVLDRELDRSPF